MKRLSWSKLFNLTALLSLGLATTVVGVNGASVTISGPIADRSPQTVQQVGARVPAVSPGTNKFKAWEGFQTTNFLNTEQYLFSPPIASVGVGPTNIITIVNRRIAMFDNPNAIIGNNPAALTAEDLAGSPTQMRTVDSPTNYKPTNEALLDAFLGEDVLRNLCPTGFNLAGGTTISCLIDHASVRYDQTQGKFIVAMTVTDTGVETLGNPVTQPRKASWVVLVSKFSTFVTFGSAGSSDVFITPTPPVGSTSGFNADNWFIYYGSAVNGLGGDGFGNVGTATSAVGPGNINSVPGILTTTPAQDGIFDCSVAAIQAAGGAAPTKVCYFPTSLRVGIDNDNIILASAVVNANYFQPPAGPTPASAPAVPAFAGTRVRVIKKGGGAPGSAPGGATNGPHGIYQKIGASLAAGNQFAATEAAKAIGDYYDLFANAAGVALAPAAFPANGALAPYTVAPITAATTLSNGLPLNPGVGIFCEPARVRGRAAASYTNSMTPTADAGGQGNVLVTSQNYLECTVTNPFFTPAPAASNAVYVQPIRYVVVNNPFNQPANTNATFTYYPTLIGDGTLNPTGMQVAVVHPFVDPTTVPQGKYLGTTPGPSTDGPALYVGDSRPQEVVFREGHLYDARVASVPGAFKVDTSGLTATVVYDIIQKLQAGAAGASSGGTAPGAPAYPPLPVMEASWTNTNAYAPMYEVPANVTTEGQTPPINTFNWLEKLFVATTFPPLSASDPRIGIQQGQNCVNYQTTPQIVGGIVTTSLSYPGLFDMRCGMDVYDTSTSFRDPVTGQLTNFVPYTNLGLEGINPVKAVTPALRGGASTDPNDGSMWNFGLYAVPRFGTINGTGQLGSYIANYGLSFPATDPYNNTVNFFSDCTDAQSCPFFTPIQIAGQQGLIGSTTGVPGGPVGVNTPVSRQEMAKLVVLSIMDEKAVAAYLNNTGGCTTTFSDVPSECGGGSDASVSATPKACSGDPSVADAKCFWRYIETMARKRITTGCIANDAIQSFCPNETAAPGHGTLTRAQMAVFLIRAKMENVYPSVISGCAGIQGPGCVGTPGGDNFGLTVPGTPYFTDVPKADPFFSYIQKMYELRISNGVAPPPAVPVYGRDQTLTRGQLIVFVVRAFFY